MCYPCFIVIDCEMKAINQSKSHVPGGILYMVPTAKEILFSGTFPEQNYYFPG